ncbi:penicillin-binding protein 2B [Oikeobacillus pervagus]|uniref:serine-type D-Ala-D-Ala carboxypeptidase n=1 Tax=Oikeobacillus pervagus TaxID=1325931 RepID=A0AAJ1WKK9_9BACI|nr:penicillin-binding protein [Oikeobacillus pervagus]MDQ0215236.1 penicillin-binding protein 2B [Oikeobacillus pervagus]
MKEIRLNRKRGAAVIFLIFAVLFFTLFFRILYIQMTGRADGRELETEIMKKYMKTNVLEARRGTIYDSHGEVIAEDTTSYTIAAVLDKSVSPNPKDPHHVVDPEMTAEVLANYIDMSEDRIYRILTPKDEDIKQVEFGTAGKDLNHELKSKIEKEKLPGIIFLKSSKRFYPNGVFASHLIGFARKEEGSKQEKTIGEMGIEQKYDEYLQGKNGKIQYESDLWGYLLPNEKEMIKEPDNGNDIYLTLDSKIQTFLEEALNDVEKQYKPERVLAVVADPKTGKLLAMGQRPSFHPDTRKGLADNWHNEVVESAFEPGSTMKSFTLAAAVEEGTFHPNAFYQSGRYSVGKGTIRDHNGGAGWGTISYLEGIQRSSNVAIANMLDTMGSEAFREYLDRFRFGMKTGIGLPNEASGNILYRYPIEKVTTAFGQGSTVTPLQLIQGTTAIANHGQMMKPYVVEKIVEPDTKKIIKDTKPKVVGKPISKETAEEVRNILGTVVTAENGTGKMYNIEGYDVAGKTGTAQLPDPKGGGYLYGSENYLFSFLGMAPKDDPQLVMYVAVEKPNLKNENGAIPVSKVFNPVMKNSLQYLNIKPNGNEIAKPVKIDRYDGKSVNEVSQHLKSQQLNVVVLGKGKKVEEQLPIEGTNVLQGAKIMLRTDGDLIVPDMDGWSLRDVMKVSELLDLKLSVNGEGYVTKQNLKPNSPVRQGDHLVVNFTKPKNIAEQEKKKQEKKKDDQVEEDKEKDEKKLPLD